MSRRKSDRNKKTKTKKKNTKFKLSNKKHKRKICDKDKNPIDTDKKKEKNINNDITVERTKLMCRRYEEFHQKFLDYDNILKFLQKTQKGNPGSTDLIKIGNSTKGKPIYMVLITTSFSSSTSPKMATFIHAGLNGENAMAVSNTLYMIEYLTKNPNFIKIMDYYIVPCCNPDAYDEYIKNKEKEGNKSQSRCCTDENKSQTNISKNEKKEKKKTCCNSPKKDKSDLKSRRCDSPSENKSNSKKLRYDSPNSGGEDHKPSCSNSPTDKKDQTQNNGGNTSVNNKTNKDDKRNSHSTTPCKGNTSVNNKTNKDGKRNSHSTSPCKPDTKNSSATSERSQDPIQVDLTLNFPVVLGLNDMKRIPTDLFLEKIKKWKEDFTNRCPETRALINAIYNFQFAIKLLIGLQEDGEAICYPYGFCAATNAETNNLREIAKKGKCAINCRNFEYGSLYDIQGLTYGTLMDFLKVDKSSIKYMYVIKVHKKTPRCNEKDELRQIMRYGCEIMECVKRMSCGVYKIFTNMTGNKDVETESIKPGIDKKSSFK